MNERNQLLSVRRGNTKNVKTPFTVSSLVFKRVTHTGGTRYSLKSGVGRRQRKSFSALRQPEVPIKTPALSPPLPKLSVKQKKRRTAEKRKGPGTSSALQGQLGGGGGRTRRMDRATQDLSVSNLDLIR